jgi:glycosyltransferase involved in cell wall biosynthesis
MLQSTLTTDVGQNLNRRVMRVLFIPVKLSVPPTNGQAIRTLSIIRALGALGHELSFVSFAPIDRPESLDPLPSYCRSIELVAQDLPNMSEGADFARRVGCLLRGNPYSIERFRSKAMRLRLSEYLDKVRFDLIFCDGIYPLVNVPETNVPIILNTHNVEYEIYKRYGEVEKNLLRRSYARTESRLVESAERRACGRASLVLACSDKDAEAFRHLNSKAPVLVVPNCVDTDFFAPAQSDEHDSDGPVLLFQGSMDWYPNRDAVEFFARSVLPRLRGEIPNIKFVVAGRNPSAEFVSAIAPLGVQFTGTVPDMRPYIEAASIVVVPLRLGSGTRIKILEACACGRAVVSTRVGAEGLDLHDGKDVVLADTPEDMVTSIIALLLDPDRRDALALAGRRHIVQRFSHTALEKSLQIAIDNLQ